MTIPVEIKTGCKIYPYSLSELSDQLFYFCSLVRTDTVCHMYYIEKTQTKPDCLYIQAGLNNSCYLLQL